MSTSINNFYVCILAGGSGERFWPMSRDKTPKHLLKLITDKTLIEETVDRLEGIVPLENIFILTSKIQVETIRNLLPNIPANQVVAEPTRRDTGPACAYATALVHAKDPNGALALLPCDSFIKDTKAFQRQLSYAFGIVEIDGSSNAIHTNPMILTFGVQPSFPSTGFGYMELEPNKFESEIHTVMRFVEKPNLVKAKEYFESGNYVWNAGIFIWKTSTFISEATKSAPELADFINHYPNSNPDDYVASVFPTLNKISVDYAILEKARRVVTIKTEFDWDDVGTWTAIEKYLKTDESGNAIRGNVISIESKNNIVLSNGRTIALFGVEDLVVVETEDAILVCHKGEIQNIKKIHSLLPLELK